MAVADYDDLVRHWGHETEVVKYGAENVAIECVDCSEVLVDFDSTTGGGL